MNTSAKAFFDSVKGKTVAFIGIGTSNLPLIRQFAEKGAKVIAMTSMQHSSGCASRHSSGKKMYEIADVTIDTCVEKGDAVFRVEGVETSVGPTSSIVGTALAEALICQVVDNLAKEGIDPPVFCSSNVDGGDEKNQWLYDTYYGYWK